MENIRTEVRPRLPIGISLILTLSLMFFMSFPVCTEVKLCRYMVVLVFALLLFIAVRSKLVIALAALPCLLAFLGAETSAAMPLLLSAVAIIGFGGFAIGAIHPLILSAAPILAYLLAFVLTGDPVGSLGVLTFVPLAIAEAITYRFKLSRTASIAALSATIIALAALILLLVLPNDFTLSAEVFSEFIISFREAMTAEIMNVLELEEFSMLFGAPTEDTVSAMINASLRLLPAAFIIGVELLAYFSCLIAVSLRTTQFPEHPLPQKCIVFRMSPTAAVLFLLSFILALLPLGNSDTVGILQVTAMNLFVILMPGLAACGALRIFSFFRKKNFFVPVLVVIILILFSSIVSITFLLAFVGAFSVLRTARTEKHNSERPKQP